MSNLKVVLVEINRLPKHAYENISRLTEMFPDLDIVLLTDSLTAKKNPEIQQKCQVVSISPELDPRLMSLSRFQNSRDTFWIYTTQRLFVLCEYHLRNPSLSLLHVESDVILMQNFPFDKFTKIDKLLWGNYSSTHDVASLIYLPTIQLTKVLYKTMLEHLERDWHHSDMTLLRAVARELGENHEYLPSIPNDSSRLINSLGSWPAEFIASQSRLFDNFQGVFDHQIVGMYLDGLNPRMTYGLRETLFDKTVETGESFVDPREVKFLLNDQLKIVDDQLHYPLYSIHMHSKNLELFRNTSKLLVKRISDANAKSKNLKFDITIFWELVVSNIRRGMLLRWSKHLIKFFLQRILAKRK